MTITASRTQRRLAAKENAKRPKALTQLEKAQWPNDGEVKRIAVWCNRDFLVQVFAETDAIRLSINRTTLRSDGRWEDDISWDDLQRIKAEVGYRDRTAYEVYPRDHDVVNVANLRHLWIPHVAPTFGWRR